MTQERESAWRPRIFRPSRGGEDAEALERLRRDDPRVQVFDPIRSQLSDLIKTRSPTRKLDDREVAERIEAHLAGVPIASYGAWVHYPWSHRLVHLLDEDEFVALRTNRNQYKITAEEQAALAGRRVGVVGLSVGQSVATTIALERSFGEIRLADFDLIDLSNLNRIRTGVHNLDVSKAHVTAREIAELDPYLRVACFPEGITDENLDTFLLEGGKLDVLVDECDSLDVKLRLRFRARAHRIPVVMDTSDRGLIDVERFDLEPDRPVFHGRVGDLDPARLRGLSNEDKIPYILQILGEDTMSDRLRASLIEVEQTIKTWPQLGTSVIHGGAAAADAARRIAVGQPVASGRFFVDLEELIGREAPRRAPAAPLAGAAPARPAWPIASLGRPLAAGAGAVDLGREQLARIVEAGVAAPSGGNCQPWKWVYEKGCLGLFHDRARSESLADFQGAGGVVALGAAAENVVLAAHREGLEVRVRPFPRAGDLDLAATFELFPAPGPDTEPHGHDALVDVLGARHTNRRPSARVPMRPADAEAIRAAVRSVRGADLQILASDDALDRIGRLIGGGDRIRLLTQRLNQDMMREIRWTGAEAEAHRDGIDVRTLELSATDRAGLEVCKYWSSLELVRQWGGGRGFEKMATKAVACASAVALLTMPAAEPSDYFQGGRAVERAWLTANRLGIAVYPMTTLPYLFARVFRGGGEGLDDDVIDAARRLRAPYLELFDVTPATGEILLFRLSVAGEPSVRSLRRPLGDVLIVR